MCHQCEYLSISVGSVCFPSPHDVLAKCLNLDSRSQRTEVRGFETLCLLRQQTRDVWDIVQNQICSSTGTQKECSNTEGSAKKNIASAFHWCLINPCSITGANQHVEYSLIPDRQLVFHWGCIHTTQTNKSHSQNSVVSLEMFFWL